MRPVVRPTEIQAGAPGCCSPEPRRRRTPFRHFIAYRDYDESACPAGKFFTRSVYQKSPSSIRMDRAPSYGVALRVTTSATPSTSAYVAKRNAPYLPPDVACSFGMKVDRLESTRASPIIPGIASRSIADVQFAGAMCRQRRMAPQRTAETIGDRAKAPQ